MHVYLHEYTGMFAVGTAFTSAAFLKALTSVGSDRPATKASPMTVRSWNRTSTLECSMPTLPEMFDVLPSE